MPWIDTLWLGPAHHAENLITLCLWYFDLNGPPIANSKSNCIISLSVSTISTIVREAKARLICKYLGHSLKSRVHSITSALWDWCWISSYPHPLVPWHSGVRTWKFSVPSMWYYRVFPLSTLAYSTLLPFSGYVKASLPIFLLFVGVSISEKLMKWKDWWWKRRCKST